MEKRYIEESFPVKDVSIFSSKEKSIRHGHISTLHIWWARRPLGCSRATNYAALIPATENNTELKKLRNQIIELSKWENSFNMNLLGKARKDILTHFENQKPKVLDPFAGGGSIPLEALRIGCETYACDYNPVAVLIEKCTLEYPQKYGEKLLIDVEKWANWVLNKVKEEIQEFYPIELEENEGYFSKTIKRRITIGYIWARTIKCQNPSCEATIPLIRQYWLAKKKDKKISLFPIVKNNEVDFKIVGTGYEKIPNNFDPRKGTVSRAFANCLVCGATISGDDVRSLFKKGKANQQMLAIVYRTEGLKGKSYKIPSENEIRAYKDAEEYLIKKQEELKKEWNFNPIPDEPTPEGKGRGAERAFSVRNYNLNTWGDLFNARQLLSIVCFSQRIREAYQVLIKKGIKEEYAKVIVTNLGLILDRLVDKNATLVVYNVVGEKIEHVFGRAALPITWDYVELNVFSEANGDWLANMNWVLRVIEHLMKTQKYPAKVLQATATNLPFEDNFFDAIFTDPPYYDNIPYSYLSDFFYVWLKRSIGHLYPELFPTLMTPKTKEIVAYTIDKTWEESKNNFEDLLKKSFKEIYRVLKPGGIAIIVYAHKTTSGWETVINALLESELNITASWPISTERSARLRATKSAALSSSIYIIARKIEKKETGFYPEVKKDLVNYLNEKLERLWQEGVAGADFFISAIGAGIEIIGIYKKIVDYEGNKIDTLVLLEDIRRIVSEFAFNQILHNGFSGELSPMTRFYILWRWNFQESKVEFDEAKKLSHSVGISLEKQWNQGIIIKSGEYIKLLGPKERKLKEIENSGDLIDILHYILNLWEKGENNKIIEIISRNFGNSEIIYRISQAISESLSNDSKEKKLIDGFLSGRKRIKESIKELKTQDSLERFLK